MRSVPSLDTRKACAYRLHIIESALPAHVIATMLAIITPVVSKLRYPDEFALFDKVPWLEFREVFAVVIRVHRVRSSLQNLVHRALRNRQ